MTAHQFHGPADHDPPDDFDNCQACVLSLCKACGGAEASLPTDCPGRKMTAYEEDNVQAGNVDFVKGEWRCTDRIDDGEGEGP